MPRPTQKRHRNNVIVGEQFRIVIPAELRKKMGIKPGDELMARVKNGQLLLEELDHALKRVQDNIVDAMEGRSGVEELIQERLRESRKERAEWEAHELARRGSLH